MARYSAQLGQRVEVHYRAGDLCLPATGTLVADSGKSIFLEEHFSQGGTVKSFRWEIPYDCIVRLRESDAASESPAPEASLLRSFSRLVERSPSPRSLSRRLPLKDRPEET